jgi:plastocyanin
MRKHFVLFTVLLAVLGVVWAQDAQDAVTDEGVVEIRMVSENGEFYFDPIGLRVDPGTTVRFILENDVHNSVAYHPDNDRPLRIPEGAEPWASPIFTEPGASFEVTLTEEGVYDYFCLPHEMMGMVGRIVVGDGQAALAQELEELDNPAILEDLPSIEQIVEQGVVHYGEQAE